MRSFVVASVLVALSSAALLAKGPPKGPVLGPSDDKSQKAPDSGIVRAPDPEVVAEPVVLLQSKSNRYGSYNVDDGTRGPYWSAQGIWNASTRTFKGLVIAAGSATISGFSSTKALLPGMTVEIAPDAFPANTTIVSVEPQSIVVSNASTKDGRGEAGSFGLVDDGNMFTQVITNYPRTFPRRTNIEWSYPSWRNDASVYSYAIIGGYGIGTGGYFRPVNKPAPKTVSEFTDLSITYDVSLDADPNDYAFLVETFPTTASDPSAPKVKNTMTNEIGFFPHVPNYLWTYILTLKDHFDYSSPDGTFHAYVATKPGKAFTQFPPYTMIVPVTDAGGRIPRDMMTGPQTLPVLGVLQELVARGIVPADSHVCGFDFGFEIGRNTGRATLNDIAWTWR